MENLQQFVHYKFRQAGNEIYRGNTEIKPFSLGGKTACTFCSYKPVCQFDQAETGNSFNELKKQSENEVFEKYKDYAEKVVAELRENGVYARADLRDEKVNYKVRELSLSKTPIIAVVGEKEQENESVTLRYLGKEGQKVKSLAEFVVFMKDAVKLPM